MFQFRKKILNISFLNMGEPDILSFDFSEMENIFPDDSLHNLNVLEEKCNEILKRDNEQSPCEEEENCKISWGSEVDREEEREEGELIEGEEGEKRSWDQDTSPLEQQPPPEKMANSIKVFKYCRFDESQSFHLRKIGTTGLYDLVAPKDFTPITIGAGQSVKINTQVGIIFPENYYCTLHRKPGLEVCKDLNLQGSCLIDSDYRGPIFIPIKNRSSVDYVVRPGSQLAYLVPEESPAAAMKCCNANCPAAAREETKKAEAKEVVEEEETGPLCIKFTKFFPNAHDPRRATPGSIGLDLMAVGTPFERVVSIKPLQKAKISLGVGFTIPPNYYGEIRDRSSMGTHKDLKIEGSGIVPNTFKQPLAVNFRNLSNKTQEIFGGECVAQIIFRKRLAIKLEEISCDEFMSQPPTKRNRGAFGSTNNYY